MDPRDPLSAKAKFVIHSRFMRGDQIVNIVTTGDISWPETLATHMLSISEAIQCLEPEPMQRTEKWDLLSDAK